MEQTPQLSPNAVAALLKQTLKQDLSDWCARHHRSREQFLDHLAAISAVEVPLSTLNHWLAVDDPRRRVPSHMLPQLARALDSTRLLDVMAGCVGHRLIPAARAADADLGAKLRLLLQSAQGTAA